MIIEDDNIYYSYEIRVLWARSEKLGFAVNICRGMMGHWNVGMLGMAVCDLFYMDRMNQKIKSGHHPLLIRFIQYSIIPAFHQSIGRLKVNPSPG